jgi:hypothetical protein
MKSKLCCVRSSTGCFGFVVVLWVVYGCLFKFVLLQSIVNNVSSRSLFLQSSGRI